MTETASFGYWLRRRRKALDLTQAELARRVGAAAVTIQKIEADERRPSRQMADLLADALAVPPDERAAFIAAARGERPTDRLPLSESPADQGVPHNLPSPTTTFIGRARELADIARLIEDGRLLTLTGPAGSGKTRLALRAAEGLRPRFPDGVTFVSLAAVTDVHRVVPTIADALGVKATDAAAQANALRDYLRDRRALLVVDNFEQVIDAAPAVADLPAHAPLLHLLVTSREPLRVYDEQEYPVPPLALPDPRRPESVETLARYEAVELFVDRARAARPAFALTPENAAAVAEICVQLDGLPLTIELAAARIRVFPPQGLLARLSHRLDLLVDGPRDRPDRQRTLRHAVRWSFDLLTPAEQALFSRLGVFVGGWTLEAAEAVAGLSPDPSQGDGEQTPSPFGRGEASIFDTLASLVAKSLVQPTSAGDGETRFTMLQVIRAFALEQLAARGETADRQRRHLDYYAALAMRSEPHFFGAEQAAWLDRLEQEHDNIRAALKWGLEAGETDALTQSLYLIGAMAWFWHLRGHWSEGRAWGEETLRMGEAAPDEARARALCGVGILAWAQDDYAAARRLLVEGLRLVSAESDPRTRAHALGLLGLTNLYENRSADARPLFEESLALFRHLEDEFGVGISLVRLAIVANQRGEYERAVALNEEALALYRRSGNPWGIATTLGNLGETATARGDWPAAATYYREALATMRATGSHWYVALLLAGIAGVAAGRGRAVEAAHLLGASEALLHRVRGRLPHLDRLTYERGVAAARAQLGDVAYRLAWEQGHSLLEDAWMELVERALED